MASEGRVWHEVLSGFEDDRAFTLSVQAGLDGSDHVGARKLELLDVLTRDEENFDHGDVPGSGTAPARRRSAGTAQTAMASAVSPTPR